MTQNARKDVRSQEREEVSGQFAIDRSGALLPPPVDDLPELSLEQLQARALSAPPVPPAARYSSRPPVFDHAAVPRVDPDLKHFSVTVPPPVEAPVYERAELEVEDLSLRLDNPYFASSLVPPAPQARSWSRVLGVAAAVVLLGAGAYALGARTASETGASSLAPAAAAVVAQAPAASAPELVPAPAPAVVEAPAVAQAPAVAVAVVAAAPAASAKVVVEAAAPAAAPEPAVAVESPEAAALVAPVAAPAAPAVVAEAPAPGGDAVAVEAAAPAVAVVTEVTVAEPAPTEVAPVAAVAGAPTEAAATDAVAPTEVPPAVELPSAPTREQVVAAFEAVRTDLVSCANGNHGTLKVDAKVLGTGRVSQALIDGVFRGTSEGSCMARALRKASFEPFAQDSLTISYPFAL